MTKIISIFLISLFASTAFSVTSISCASDDGYKLDVSVETLKSFPLQSEYVFSKDGEKIKSGVLTTDFIGYESFLEGYYWAFTDENDSTEYDHTVAFFADGVRTLPLEDFSLEGGVAVTVDEQIHSAVFEDCTAKVLAQ